MTCPVCGGTMLVGREDPGRTDGESLKCVNCGRKTGGHPPLSAVDDREARIRRRRRLRHVLYGEPEEERIGITGDDETPPPYGNVPVKKRKSGRRS